MSLLEQDTTRKKWVDKNVIKFEACNSKEYKIEVIWDSTVYANKTKGHLLSLYYFIAWKKYFKEKKTWNPHLQFST